jgi:hypothetical protein
MSQDPGGQSNHKEKTAAWIARRPLVSVVATATIAFFLGIGAGASDASDPSANTKTISSSIDGVEEELEEAEAALQVAEGETNELQDENAALEDQLSTKTKALRRTRASLAATRNQLIKARGQAKAAAVASADPEPAAPSGGTEPACDPNYSGSCVPVVSYDLNCDDISGSVTVVGSDPHGFDGDGDGSGCE